MLVLKFTLLRKRWDLFGVNETTAAAARRWAGACVRFYEREGRTLKREALMYLTLSSLSSSEDIS